MPQQLADDRQAKPATCAKACIGVAEIMKAHAIEASAPRHRLPWTFQISARPLGIAAMHDIRAKLTEAGEDRKCRSVKNHGLPAGLGVGEEKQSSLQVHLLPL